MPQAWHLSADGRQSSGKADEDALLNLTLLAAEHNRLQTIKESEGSFIQPT